MDFDPKTALSVLLGLAGALRTVGQLAEAVNALAGHVLDDETVESPVPPCIKLDDLAPLFVLLADLETAAAKLELRSPVLRALRNKRLRKSRTAPARGMAHYEQDEVTDSGSDTDSD